MSRIKATCKQVQLHLMSQSTLTLFYFLFSLKYLRQKLLHSQTRVRLFIVFWKEKQKQKEHWSYPKRKCLVNISYFWIPYPAEVRLDLSHLDLASHITVYSQQRPIRLSVIITSLIGPQSITRHECDPHSKADQDLKLLTTENIGPLINAFKGRSVNNGVMDDRNEAA